MLVVSDTSTLSNLAIIGRLDLLHLQFGEVLMPPAAVAELAAMRDPLGRAALSQALHEGWLAPRSLLSCAPFPVELRGLDPGETEALRLALWLAADRVLMDEREGRLRAAMLGIRTIGVLGVLIAAKHSGLIPTLKDALTKLRHDAGFFIAKSLEAQALAAVGE
jgi:predicted nucleic acid-binding protein